MAPEPVPPSRSLAWLRTGTDHLSAHVAKIPEDRLDGLIALPGWTAAHLLTHLARNADALGNLVEWATTGVETPMYPGGPAQRAADIESGVHREPRAILADFADSAVRLSARLDALPDEAWTRTVHTPQGDAMPAAVIPWLRVREVWIHAIDLNTGATFADLPGDLATTLLDDVVSRLAAQPDCPALILRPGTGTALVTRPDAADAAEVAGTTAALLGWLTGRTTGAGLGPEPLPDLPTWL
ncbi:mycothiol-dependent maleylpyruvate isomerase [Actinomadura rubteroloni]|uniref:Mycothiol-dependent maleylpyruvate isomerase n=1 Tax=Actinomadura rubteroloni TaxID=1926885 RepID=A0A2P4UIU6_9ACTN|nr:maleylpyruvate isomerase family mycothiol-dependent enzyme [Actinomadura rubteroloni]POM24928.1 mycothiol-dependent maleylpyruvate isomerase [Actinomadura rubteroloni]